MDRMYLDSALVGYMACVMNEGGHGGDRLHATLRRYVLSRHPKTLQLTNVQNLSTAFPIKHSLSTIAGSGVALGTRLLSFFPTFLSSFLSLVLSPLRGCILDNNSSQKLSRHFRSGLHSEAIHSCDSQQGPDPDV